MNLVYLRGMDQFTRSILHCPECGRELMSQAACDNIRAQMNAEQPENPVTEMTVFCEHCKKFRNVIELAQTEKYLS